MLMIKKSCVNNAFNIHMPQLVNEHDTFPIAVEKDKLKLLYSLDTWVILSLILCVLLLLWKRNLCLLICLGYLDVHFTLLLANIIIKESIWYTEFIFVQI
jgi:hypothetical protein